MQIDFVMLLRPTYVCTRTEGGQGYAPLDAELGLDAPMLTPRLARVACRAGITIAGEEAALHREEELGVAVPCSGPTCLPASTVPVAYACALTTAMPIRVNDMLVRAQALDHGARIVVYFIPNSDAVEMSSSGWQ